MVRRDRGRCGAAAREVTSPTRPLGGDFRRFLAAAAVSNLGDGIRLGALPLLALSLTDDARLIALVSAATLLPWLVFGPLGGALVDRHDRRCLMVGGQFARAVVVGGLAALIATDTVNIWWVVIAAFGLGVGEVVVDSASQAAIPQLVPDNELDRANGQLIAAMTVFDQVVGVALGAALFGLATGLPFIVDALTFVVGATLVLTVRSPLQGTRSQTTTVRADIAEGMRFLFRHKLLRSMMTSVAISNLAGNIGFAVLVILVADELGATGGAFGLVLGAGAIGGVLGSLVASRLAERFGRRRVLIVLPPVLTVTHLANAVATEVWMIAASLFVSSFTIVCFNVPGQSIRQTATPEPLLGRVVATFRMVGMGAAPLGAVIGGFVTQAADVRVAYFLAAVVSVCSWLVLVAGLRHFTEPIAASPTTANR